jgi:hypothetical protein
MRTQRRALLRAVAGAAVAAPALAACDLFEPDPPPPPDPLTGFHAQTLALVTLYETAEPRFAAIRDAHRAHADAIAKIMYPAPSSASPAAASAGPSAAPAATAPAPASLRQAEQTAWRQAVEACLAAPAARATLLGEIAAARACHLEALP